MFSGIIEQIGTVSKIEKTGLAILIPKPWRVRIGESIAVNGVCLSVSRMRAREAQFDCMPETFRKTALSDLRPGDSVNLERPSALNARIGGHLLSGHVDGVGKIKSRKRDGISQIVRIGSLAKLSRYFVEKGSVAVDGVSLTIIDVSRDGFWVGLIPITQKATTLGRKRVGERVNIEVDMLAKMVERLI